MNQVSLLVRIALQLMRARLKQSLVAGVGVTFGIAMYITLMGFMTGLNGLLDGLILNRTPHVRLYNEIEAIGIQPISKAYPNQVHMVRHIKPKDRGRKIYQASAILQELRKDPRVLGVAPQTQAQVFVSAGVTDLNAVVTGIEVNEEKRLFRLHEYMVDGDLNSLEKNPGHVVIGIGMAKKLMLSTGDALRFTTPKGQSFPFRITGIFQSGLAEIDKTQCYASITATQKLLGQASGYYTDIQVKLHDIALAPAMARELELRFKANAIDIQTANAQFDTGTSVRNLISYAVSITLLVVAGFGIYNILNMMIFEKMDTIAILKATGFSGGDVKGIFLSMALIIGVCGGLLGLVVGFALQNLIALVPFETEAFPTITTYPVNQNPAHYVIGLVFALATTYFAGLLPARKAASVDPVDIIRGK